MKYVLRHVSGGYAKQDSIDGTIYLTHTDPREEEQSLSKIILMIEEHPELNTSNYQVCEVIGATRPINITGLLKQRHE